MSKTMTMIFSGAALLSIVARAQEPPPAPPPPPSGQTTAGAPAGNAAHPSGQRRFF